MSASAEEALSLTAGAWFSIRDRQRAALTRAFHLNRVEAVAGGAGAPDSRLPVDANGNGAQAGVADVGDEEEDEDDDAEDTFWKVRSAETRDNAALVAAHRTPADPGRARGVPVIGHARRHTPAGAGLSAQPVRQAVCTLSGADTATAVGAAGRRRGRFRHGHPTRSLYRASVRSVRQLCVAEAGPLHAAAQCGRRLVRRDVSSADQRGATARPRRPDRQRSVRGVRHAALRALHPLHAPRPGGNGGPQAGRQIPRVPPQQSGSGIVPTGCRCRARRRAAAAAAAGPAGPRHRPVHHVAPRLDVRMPGARPDAVRAESSHRAGRRPTESVRPRRRGRRVLGPQRRAAFSERRREHRKRADPLQAARAG
eukprot:ctg_1132.g368